MRATLLILAALTASAQERQPGRGVNFYSRDKEAAVGASLIPNILRQTTRVDSKFVQDFVNRIGSRLAAQIPAAPYPYTFTVIAGDLGTVAHEASALPGGYIFVPAQLILAAKDEAEFAGMLAHSMVHVSERHATRTATRGEIANMSTVPLIFMGGWTGYGARQGASILIPVGFLRFQRDIEIEADVRAVTITSNAGFDPSALVGYVGREHTPAKLATVLESMPTPAQRVSRMETEIQKLPEQIYAAPDPNEFDSIQAEVRRP
jgi:predicted Zn-dependent protease